MIGLARQMTLRRNMDILANNIANTSTNGFKAERLLLETNATSRASHEDGPNKLSFVDDWGLGRDFSQGSLVQTGRDLDFAIDGEGFFSLETANGERFTRDGNFTLNGDNEIVTADGARLLDEFGNPIQINPAGGRVTMTESGQLTQGEVPIAKVGVVTFNDLGQLEKRGNNRFFVAPNIDRVPAEDMVLRQGFTEQSNVTPIMEMTRMMEISRTYASVSRMIQQTEDLSRRALERLGRS